MTENTHSGGVGGYTWGPITGDIHASNESTRTQERYEVGYRDGENNAHADWQAALDEILPEWVAPYPGPVAKFIRELLLTIEAKP